MMSTKGRKNRIIILVVLSFLCVFVVSLIDESIVGGETSVDLASGKSPLRDIVLPAAPSSTQPPQFENPHDSTFFYAKARNYGISVNVTDTEGYSDIDNVSLSLFDDSRTIEYWTVTYYENFDTFSKTDPSGYITLVTGLCRYWKSGDDLDILFAISVDWDHPDISNPDTRVYSFDNTNSTIDWYETSWDVETRLDYVVSPSVTADDGGTVDRGDLDETFHITGTVEYYGSASSVRPPSNQVDVWVSASQYGTNVGPWNDLTLVAGAFDVTCYADDQVGQDTYTVKVVAEGTGSGGTDLYHTPSVTDTYIADQIQVQSYNFLNASRVGIGFVAYERVVFYYAYDMTAVVDGTATVNGISAVYSAVLSGWVFSDTKATPQAVTYNAVSYTGGTHGLDGAVDQNGQSLMQIWDALNIVITDPIDQRINIYENASGIVVTATYAYDSAVFNGTLTLNETTFQYSTVGKRGYTVLSASGGSFPLVTAIGTNDETYCIWDRLVISIQANTNTPPNEQEVTFDLVVTFDYDDTVCTAYQLVVERNGTWWNSFSYANRSSFTDSDTDATYEYAIQQITSEPLYGITAFSANLVIVTWSVAPPPLIISLPIELFVIAILAPLVITVIVGVVVVATSVKFWRFTREWKKAIKYSKAVISGRVAQVLSSALKQPYQNLEKISNEISNIRSNPLATKKVIDKHNKRVTEYLQQVSNAIKKLTREDFPPYVLGVLQSIDIALEKLQTEWLELITTLLDAMAAVKEEEKEEEIEKTRVEYQQLLDEYKETIDELRLIIAELVQVGGQPGG